MMPQRSFHPLFERLVAAAIATSPLTVGIACGGVTLEPGADDAGTSPSTTSENPSRPNRDGGVATVTDASRPKPDARRPDAQDDIDDELDAEVNINPDSGVVTWDRDGGCGDIGQRPSLSWCDYYERQVPCGVSSNPTPAECEEYCMGEAGTLCSIYNGMMMCNACPGGRKPSGYVLASHDGATPVASFLARLAELEAISVDAFAMIEVELRAYGAPAGLLARLRAARADEARHARVTSDLARSYGATVPAIAFVPPPLRSLETIALENAVEGCVRETYGALVASVMARRAEDPAVRAIFATIACDEARHAELSWDLHDWLMPRLSSAARDRVERARQEAARAMHLEVQADASALRSLGVPSAAEAMRLVEGLDDALWQDVA